MTTTMDLDHIHSQYHQLGGTDLSDAALVRAVADRVRHPRLDPADSFILHAPLELLARAALLPWVNPDGREAARLRLVALVTQFETPAPAACPPVPVSVDSPADAAHQLVGALDTGDLDRVDALATALAAAVSPSELTALLAEAVLPRLAAAGHAPIFLYHLPRVSPRGEAAVELLRPLARELARYPDLKIRWTESRPTGAGSEEALADALRNVGRLGIPGMMV